MAKYWPLLLMVYFHFAWYGIIWLIKNGHESLSPQLAIGGWIIAFASKEPFTSLGRKQYSLALLVSLVGCLFDFTAWKLGGISFISAHPELSNGFPLWMFSIWILFASVLPLTSFAFRNKRNWAGLAGAIGGPFSYWLAQQLGVLRFSNWVTVAVYVMFWGIFFQVITMSLNKNEKSTGSVL